MKEVWTKEKNKLKLHSACLKLVKMNRFMKIFIRYFEQRYGSYWILLSA